MLDLQTLSSPVPIASLEVVQGRNAAFLCSTSRDGASGLTLLNDRIRYLQPILEQLVIPFFAGRDARDLEELVEGAYLWKANYKLAGLALWNCVAWVEWSLLDLLGRVAGKPVYELLGGALRREIPVYLSSMRRDTTPEAEVAWLQGRLEATGARAVKLKIGGRMSRNQDAAPHRTERLIALARETFGPSITIYADANGSYDARRAIEVGRMLEDWGVAWLEEPCPWEEHEETKRVADALTLPVAGGEQDSSLPRFRWMIQERGVDIVQPDLAYNGGLLRTRQVARIAAEAGMLIAPHSPKSGAQAAPMLHFAASTPNIGPFMEWDAVPHAAPSWQSPALEIQNGAVVPPCGPGLGLSYNPDILPVKAQT